MSADSTLPPAPSRILMTTDTVGGVWDYSLDLCRALRPFGVEVILATMGDPPRQGQRIEAAGVENVQLIESRYKLEWMQDPWGDVEAAGTWLELMEAQFAPDLIHLNSYAHAVLPWSAPVVVVAHSDVLSWWKAVRGGMAPKEWNHYAETVARGLAAADAIVAPSRAMLDAMESHYGPLPRARVVHNGREGSRYNPAEKEAFVLTAGTLWDEAKNARMMTETAADLDWPVKLAGDSEAPDGGGRVRLRNVELLGQLAPGEMATQFARASIYALPARYEPFGLTVLEAGLSGCALVLGDIPSLRELWDEAAEFVPPDDRSALQDSLCRLIRDPELRARRAREAFQRAQQYGIGKMVQAYLSTYADAVRAPRFADSTSAHARA